MDMALLELMGPRLFSHGEIESSTEQRRTRHFIIDLYPDHIEVVKNGRENLLFKKF